MEVVAKTHKQRRTVVKHYIDFVSTVFAKVKLQEWILTSTTQQSQQGDEASKFKPSLPLPFF